MDRSGALHTHSSALSKHFLIQAKAREKNQDSGDNKRKVSAGTLSTNIHEEISTQGLDIASMPFRACYMNMMVLVTVAPTLGQIPDQHE